MRSNCPECGSESLYQSKEASPGAGYVPNPRFLWLRRAFRSTLILGLSVLTVSWVLSDGNTDESVRTALLAASMGAAFGTLEYRFRANIPAKSSRTFKLWLCSVLWCIPFLWPSQRFPFPPEATSDIVLAIFLACLLCVVSFVPLRWLHGQWVRDSTS